MNVKYRSEKNKIELEIKTLLNNKTHAEDTISRIRKEQVNLSFNQAQIEKLKNNIITYSTNIENLKDRLLAIEKGDLNEELDETYKKNKAHMNKLIEASFRKKNEEKKQDVTNAKKSKDFFESQRSDNRQNKADEREYDRSLRFFRKQCSYIKPYMLSKLANMPSNKGWRDVNGLMWAYGDLPDDGSNVVTMFSKDRDTLYIHEYDYNSNVLKVFKKEGQNRKEMVSRTPIKRMLIR